MENAINTALCSFGMSGWVFHAPFLKIDPHFHFYAAWERSKNLAAEKYPDVITYRTLEEMLSDKEVELVVVNTPNYTHYDYAKKALEAGKHVIVEKPFTVTVAEGEELIDLADKKGKLLSVYQNRRYDSDYRTVKKIVEEGWLGTLCEAEFHYDRYKEELSPKVHKEVPGSGTGALYDLGSHLIDQALQLFGMPQAVFGDIRIIRPISQVDDYFEVLLYYPELRVRLHSSYLVREPLPAYILHGNKGTFIKAKTDIQETELQAGAIPGTPDWGKEPESEKGFLHTEKDGQVIREHIPSLQGNYGDYYNGIYEAIRNGAPIPVTASDGLNVIRIITAAFKSNDEKRIVEL
ncbi:MAG: Gfo/Idh/MocA family oxidoreductase [Flavisolibacter sp.]|nr:Gfo/Idh/MocA family oxidoreductase [Flavisolibacter sp.]MBD0284294.1 Gfo/Idh/MocA family oxidoreductase [Flavisolibacter sp.]MBD0296331.1 Gfo/Idh/MocA family oxidoreductase [Flavisolibacter sp.]MBD0367526.1 Gfo/Idh/MocA family oxidoreductase [Flavisolibacter sp.]